MKNIKFLFLSMIVVSLLNACDIFAPDDYNQSIGTLYLDGIDGYDFYIKIDGGPVLVSEDFDFDLSSFDDSTRVIFYFSEIDEYEDSEEIDLLTKIRDISKVPVKPVYFFTDETSIEEKDSIGTDPVSIIDAWIIDDYLNVEYTYWGSGRTHHFDLVYDEVYPISPLGELSLRLAHQDYDDDYYTEYWNLISYDISSLKFFEPDSFIIRLGATDYDDYDYSESFIYRHDNN